MKYLRQLAIILVICFLGEALNRLFNIPIPGNVIGMVILLIALITGIIKLESIEGVTDFLLKHLAFFFVPAGIGVISSFDIIKTSLIPMLIVIVLSTIIVIAVTGITVQLLKGGR
ncbi:CidA/LrgA family protein [Clostridium swellfunianum]|uniref:CidA/LrgA family protein n=1 Tax=Clostridium swellfunianum TaxID=1367462 RepID=UPI00202DD60C|nr:CidA/LrgA family protein [Clostridium swellfunianum]MCM0646922.1 CidA/LrgA family protein [Clostridium swellfunianum]